MIPKRPWSSLILVLVALALYGRVIEFEFVNYDDNAYFTENPHVTGGLTEENVKWAFEIHGPSMWVPLTWLSHQTMVSLFGAGPAPQHALNLILHAINCALLFIVLCRLTHLPGRSFIVALIFAIHPIHAESVAWVTERKDVLSLFFCLLALLAYERHARIGGWKWYGLVVLCHALAVMAKPLAVTLPCAMLLLDYWPLQRLRTPLKPVLEKLPLLAISAVASWLTVLCQFKASAIGSVEDFPFHERVGNAIVSYATYLRRCLFPNDLSVFYPYPDDPLNGIILASIVVGVVTASALLLWRKVPALLIGWLWFLGTLVPMIGIVQAGGAGMANRYAYFTFIGLYVAIVWTVSEAATRWPTAKKPLQLIMSLWLIMLAVMAVMHLGVWKNSRSLMAQSIKATDGNYLAYNNLGLAYRDQGLLEKAEASFIASLEIRPKYAEARINLGILRISQGRLMEGFELLDQVVQLYPEHPIAWHNLGKANAELGQLAEARKCFLEALKIDPGYTAARYDLGTLLVGMGEWQAAVEMLRELLEMQPDHADAWVNLGFALAKLGDNEEAESAYRKAISIGSDLGRGNLISHWLNIGKFQEVRDFLAESPDPAASLELIRALREHGQLAPALTDAKQLVDSHPAYADARYELGLIYGMQGNHKSALKEFRTVLEIQPDYPGALQNARFAEQNIGQE